MRVLAKKQWEAGGQKKIFENISTANMKKGSAKGMKKMVMDGLSL